jgi:hypothetical protein
MRKRRSAKMKKSLLIFVPLLIMLAAAVSMAGPIVNAHLNSVSPGQDVFVTFAGTGGENTRAGISLMEVTTPGPYKGVYNSFCVENADIYYNTNYEFEIQPLSYAISQAPGNANKWKAAAWLLQTYGGTSNNTIARDAQLAVWDIIIGITYSGDQTFKTYEQLALAAAPTFDASGYAILANPAGGDPNLPPVEGTQNFIIHVPEPGLILLLGLGLIGVTALYKKIN